LRLGVVLAPARSLIAVPDRCRWTLSLPLQFGHGHGHRETAG